MALPCGKFLLECNESVAYLLAIFCLIWIPALALLLVFFVSLAVYPGFGCAAARNLEPPYADGVHTVTEIWFCSPGIVGSYNYGDCFGRVFTGAVVYKLLTSQWCLGLSILRLSFIPLLLMGVAGTSLYSFGYGDMGATAYNIVLNLTIGLTNGFLSTVTMGIAPRMLKPEDRESGGAVMVSVYSFVLPPAQRLDFSQRDQGWLRL